MTTPNLIDGDEGQAEAEGEDMTEFTPSERAKERPSTWAVERMNHDKANRLTTPNLIEVVREMIGPGTYTHEQFARLVFAFAVLPADAVIVSRKLIEEVIAYLQVGCNQADIVFADALRAAIQPTGEAGGA